MRRQYHPCIITVSANRSSWPEIKYTKPFGVCTATVSYGRPHGSQPSYRQNYALKSRKRVPLMSPLKRQQAPNHGDVVYARRTHNDCHVQLPTIRPNL
uniref:Uncharacterized protein n=1 Tax=Steinernema glaseri TaxID=37863 RepID=A0A1I8A786_9BILA